MRLASRKTVWEWDYSPSLLDFYIDVWALCRHLNSMSTSEFYVIVLVLCQGLGFYINVWAWVLCRRLSPMSLSEFILTSGLSCWCLGFQTLTSEWCWKFDANGLPYAQTSPSHVTGVRCQLLNGTNYWTLESWLVLCECVISARHLISSRCIVHSARQFCAI